MMNEPLFVSSLNRVGSVLKEVYFPTQCLVCRSFFPGSSDQCLNFKKIFCQLENSGTETGVPTPGGHNQFESTGHPHDFQDHFKKKFTTLMSPFFCTTCSATFLPVESPMCSKCGIIFKSRQGGDHECGDCIEEPKKYGMARSAGVYDQALMWSVHCLKYKGKIQLAEPLGILLFAAFSRYWGEKRIDIIVPVPLHGRKLRTRGFNPSFLLVRNWPHNFEMLNGRLPGIPVENDILYREKWTEPQTGLGRKERLENLKNAFVVEDTSKVQGKKILVVDDVYTTGATVNECAKTLLKEGCEQVDVLTLSRVM